MERLYQHHTGEGDDGTQEIRGTKRKPGKSLCSMLPSSRLKITTMLFWMGITMIPPGFSCWVSSEGSSSAAADTRILSNVCPGIPRASPAILQLDVGKVIFFEVATGQVQKLRNELNPCHKTRLGRLSQ